MYIAIMYDKEVSVGTEIEITGAANIKFEVTAVDPVKEVFEVVWSTGSNKGAADTLPFVIFGKDVVKIKKISDNNEPNSAFMRKRHAR